MARARTEPPPTMPSPGPPPRTRSRRSLADRLEAFDNDHGDVILNALAVYAERMRETAAEASRGADLPDEPVQTEPDEAGYITIRPTAAGFRHMAAMFNDAADKADKARREYERLAGRDR